MPTVRLKKSWPCNFKRSVRDESGEVLSVIEFEPGEPIEVDLITLDKLRCDIGAALELLSETATLPGAVIVENIAKQNDEPVIKNAGSQRNRR